MPDPINRDVPPLPLQPLPQPRAPREALGTHAVENQPQPLGDMDLYASDAPLRDCLRCFGPDWLTPRIAPLGAVCGSAQAMSLGFQANENPPRLRTFDRYGRRIDEVEYHPAYHWFMNLAMRGGWHSVAWDAEGQGGAVAHVAGLYLLTQPEQGFCCPVTMTHAVVPALRHQPDLAAEWEPRIRAHAYDPRSVPAPEKDGVTFGMAMTEKQGGSDVRANSTRAEPEGDGGYRLTGHKWFCSAPMSDAFLTLAQAPADCRAFWCRAGRPTGHAIRFTSSASRTSWEIAPTHRARSNTSAPGPGESARKDTECAPSSRWSTRPALMRPQRRWG